MANFNELIPFILYWETSTPAKPGETSEQTFARARAKGMVNDPADAGGVTVCGVTLSTYTSWRRQRGFRTTGLYDLKNIPYEDWLRIMKNLFWDRWNADQILSQPVANMLVDWTWTSGVNGIKIPQKLLGLNADGVAGTKTVQAVNRADPEKLFTALRNARTDFVRSIAARKPAQKKFLKGWLNRINAITYDGLTPA